MVPGRLWLVEIALARGATLLTADRAIIDWPGPLLRQAAGA
jgi:hypothetical protein